MTIALMLALTRRVVEGDRFVRRRERVAVGADVHARPTGSPGMTLGIVGFGRIGQAVARLAEAHGMTRPPLDSPLDELLAAADVVSLHVPLTPETHHLIGERELALMKPSAYLVNTSRGAVVDEAALARALAAERDRRRGARRLRARARGRGGAPRAGQRHPRPAPRLGDARGARGDGDALRRRASRDDAAALTGTASGEQFEIAFEGQKAVLGRGRRRRADVLGGRSRRARRLRRRRGIAGSPRSTPDSVAEPARRRELRVRRPTPPAADRRARPAECDPRPRATSDLEGSRARARPGACWSTSSIRGLGYPFSVALEIAYVLSGDGSAGDDPGDEHRPRALSVRKRSAPVRDRGNGARRRGGSLCARKLGLTCQREGHPRRRRSRGGVPLRLPTAAHDRLDGPGPLLHRARACRGRSRAR